MSSSRPGRILAICCVWLAAFVATAYGDCGPPIAISNAAPEEDVTDKSFPIDSTVKYVCDATKGYVKIPGNADTITCQDDSSWSTIEEFCKPSCGMTPRLLFGELMDRYVGETFFPVGSRVTYNCRPGYTPRPRFQRIAQCLPSMKWSEIEEFCQPRDCGNPGDPQNGQVELPFEKGSDYPDTKLGSTATFSCNTGFRLIGRNTRLCTARGWSNAVPECEPVVCSEPPNIVNGRHTGYGQEEFYYLSGVTYHCDADWFELIGEKFLHCADTGDWSAAAPICKDRRCPDPQIENAIKIVGFKSLYLYKDVVQFRCKEGFNLDDPRPLQCGEDNRWHPMPVCKPIICEEPPAIVNGTHSGRRDQEQFQYKELVKYSCNYEELSLIGADTIQCVGEGVWSKPPPKCKVVLCEDPLLPDGSVTFTTRPPHRYGSTVRFHCDRYFKLEGKAKIECQENSMWDHPVPSCRRVSCPEPVVAHSDIVKHSQLTLRYVYPVRAWIVYKCNPGYVMNGSSEIHCGSDYQWAPSLPTCLPRVSCPEPEIKNGNILQRNAKQFQSGLETGYNVSEQIEFSCLPKYVVNGSRTIICREDLTWNLSGHACVPRQTCLQPNITNGRITWSSHVIWNLELETGYPHGTAITFGCDPGHRQKTKTRVACKSDLEWTLPAPICELIVCPNVVVKNGMIIERREKPTLNDGYRLNDTVEIQCANGYKVKGKKESRCNEYSQWSPSPTCEPVTCPEPKVNNGLIRKLKKGSVSDNKYRFGDMVQVQCNKPDYSLNGPQNISCRADSTWSAISTCQLVRCDEPQVLNGHVVCRHIIEPALASGYRASDRVTVQCDRGYNINGISEIRCEADSKWSALPNCEPVEQHAPWFLPLGRDPLHYTEESILTKDTEIQISSEELCKLALKNIEENWQAMTPGDKYSHLQIRKLCQEIPNGIILNKGGKSHKSPKSDTE